MRKYANPLSLLTLLLATAVLYLWGLGASGWANGFYSAAVQAGASSWKAFFFGSSDASNFITVDKTPGSLWIMDLSARIFGVNAWSILVPEALEGVAAVGVLYAAVRRWFGHGAGLLAGSVLALTPVAALMFRFNNPDALLILLLVAAAYATVRAVEDGKTTWLLLAGTFIGFGFLAKMLQAFLVVPVFGGVYLFAGPRSFGRRLWQSLAGMGALLVAAGWWVVAVQLTPVADRPYIGGSQNNSLWNLMFGYNGFGRLTGSEAGSVGGMGAVGSRWGATGWNRLFQSEMGGQISWLLPSALIVLLAGLLYCWRKQRIDRTRAALLLWGGWLLVTAITFSFGKGIIHPYYTVALAPAIAGVIGIGCSVLWARRDEMMARCVLAATLLAAVLWSYVLLNRTADWMPWLRSMQLIVGGAIAIALVGLPTLRNRLGVTVATLAIVVALSGPTAYSLNTVRTTHDGAIPSAGPAVAGGFGGPGGGGGGRAGFAGGPTNGGGQGFLAGSQATGTAGASVGTFAGGGPSTGGGAGPTAGGAGGILGTSAPSAALTKLLEANSKQFTWVAAVSSSNQAAGYQLATRQAVMAIGGFNGTDPAPSLAQFEQYVKDGKIHYFIASSGGLGQSSGGFGASSDNVNTVSNQIASWVESHYTATTVDGVTVYDLTQ